MIDLCNLGSVRRRPVGELSKGFRQRVGLAQTLIHDPEVLILDEPTTGLDPNQIVQIRELIKKIGREKTVILSTHILQEVEATCSRVQIINDGRIVARGTTDELTRLATGDTRVIVRMKAPPAARRAEAARAAECHRDPGHGRRRRRGRPLRGDRQRHRGGCRSRNRSSAWRSRTAGS